LREPMTTIHHCHFAGELGSSALLVVCLRTIPEMDIPFPKFNGVLNDPPVSPLGGP
jgi:hypothetical protein